MRAVKLCSTKILQFLTGRAGHKMVVVVVVVVWHSFAILIYTIRTARTRNCCCYCAHYAVDYIMPHRGDTLVAPLRWNLAGIDPTSPAKFHLPLCSSGIMASQSVNISNIFAPQKCTCEMLSCSQYVQCLNASIGYLQDIIWSLSTNRYKVIRT